MIDEDINTIYVFDFMYFPENVMEYMNTNNYYKARVIEKDFVNKVVKLKFE